MSARLKLEGPYDPRNPHTQYLDLVGEGDTLDRIYRENLFEQLGGIDTVRPIDLPRAVEYVEEVIASVNTVYRGTTPESDPLVAALREIASEFGAGFPVR